MTDLRTAAQQALEALELLDRVMQRSQRTDAAIDALRAALADQDRGRYTIDEINAKFDPEWSPRRDDMNRWEAEIHSWRQRYEALLKTVADHKSLAPPMMLADKQSYELGLLDGAAAEREACAKVCEIMEQQAEGTECCKWPTPIDCAAAIRARGNT